MSRTNFHGPKDVRAIEIRLYKYYIFSPGDLMGPVVKNLENLLRLPTGCGEQTMSSFAPDVFVSNYLENTNQLTTEIKDKAVMYMQKGTIEAGSQSAT